MTNKEAEALTEKAIRIAEKGEQDGAEKLEAIYQQLGAEHNYRMEYVFATYINNANVR